MSRQCSDGRVRRRERATSNHDGATSNHDGERSGELVDEPPTIEGYAYVARQVKETARKLAPSFEHAAVVADLSDEQQELLLAEAREQGWSARDLLTVKQQRLLRAIKSGPDHSTPVRERRRGRGKSVRSLELIKAAIEVLREIQPASVRAICYRLFTMKRIASMAKSETNRVSTLLTYAREHRVIAWDWIVDETREPERVSAFEHPADYIEVVRRSYRKDRWTDQPEWIEVWSEKGTIRGTLRPVLDAYGVTFRVMHGYGSATAIYEAAQDSQRGDKLLTVFYVGDHDPSGLHMSEVDLPRRAGKNSEYARGSRTGNRDNARGGPSGSTFADRCVVGGPRRRTTKPRAVPGADAGPRPHSRRRHASRRDLVCGRDLDPRRSTHSGSAPAAPRTVVLPPGASPKTDPRRDPSRRSPRSR